MAAYLPLLLQPREVEALAGLPVATLAASKTHSAAVLESGEALTWGEGSEGKLGHGGTGALGGCRECVGECIALPAARAGMSPSAIRRCTAHPPNSTLCATPRLQTARTCRTAWSRWRGACT